MPNMRWLPELLAIVAPPTCAACGRSLPRTDERLCADCAIAVPWLFGGCPRCALPVHRGRDCPAAACAFTRCWAAVSYDGVARQLVTALKFRGALPVAGVMATQMAAHLPEPFREPSAALVPVPAVRIRSRARGFDPAHALATALGTRIGLPVTRCLVRHDRSRRQVGASRAVRRASGRLDVRVRGTPPPRALLIDDVHTTGATLDACARALVADGRADVIAAISYARTL
jgi:predicted amidophosphoribosyltransferase